MTHQEILEYCLGKQGAYLDFPFGTEFPVIKVKAPSQTTGRIFAQLFILRGEQKVTLNCTSDSAEFYRTIYPDSVVRGWHCPPIQQPYFNTIDLGGAVPHDELLTMIDHSYDTVLTKLPKYIRKQLQEADNE